MVNAVLSSDQEAPTTPQAGKPLTPLGEYLFGVDPMFSLEGVAGDCRVDPSAISRRERQRLPVLFFRAWDRLRRDSEQDYDAYQDWGNNAHFSSPRAPEENLHAIN